MPRISLSCCLGLLGATAITILTWHPLGILSSQKGVQQQGDLLGFSLYSLVLQQVVKAISEDDECAELQQNDWCMYLDDAIQAGTAFEISRTWDIIQNLGQILAYRNVSILVKTDQCFVLQYHTQTSHILRFWES